MTSSLLWITPLVPLIVGLGMLLVRDRRLLAALDVGGSVAVLGLTLAIARRVAQSGAISAAGAFRADELGEDTASLERCCIGAASRGGAVHFRARAPELLEQIG